MVSIPDLYIIGAGGLGREVAQYLRSHPDRGVRWNVAGHLDDSPPENLEPSIFPLSGRIQDFVFRPGDLAVLAVGTPATRKLLAERLSDRVEWLTLVAGDAFVGSSVKVGRGTVIAPGVKITTSCSIGEFALINLGSMIGHDCRIGDYSCLYSLVAVGGHCCIGREVTVGSGAILAPGVSVSDQTVVGTGSVVTRNIREKGTWFGNPARKIL